jgi:hypothetical protein
MSERILWFILAIIAVAAASFFFVVERDSINAGAAALLCLCFLNFRAQATS